MSFSIKIDNVNKLIRYEHSGNISKEDIGQAWDSFLKIKEFTVLKYNLLSDYTNATFVGTAEDVDVICNILASMKDILKGKKQAMLMDSPKNTALTMLFEREVIKKVGFIVEIFSTEEAALGWLL